MKKIISASFLAALALTMLLPVARQVNAASVNVPVHAHKAGIPHAGRRRRRTLSGRQLHAQAEEEAALPGRHPDARAAEAATFRAVFHARRRRRRPLSSFESGPSRIARGCYPASEVILVVYFRRFGPELMNHLENFLILVPRLSFEMVLCGFVFARKVQRILPFFAAYTCAILAGTIGVWLTYEVFRISFAHLILCYWSSIPVECGMRVVLRSWNCAATDYALIAASGALVWRVFGGSRSACCLGCGDRRMGTAQSRRHISLTLWIVTLLLLPSSSLQLCC